MRFTQTKDQVDKDEFTFEFPVGQYWVKAEYGYDKDKFYFFHVNIFLNGLLIDENNYELNQRCVKEAEYYMEMFHQEKELVDIFNLNGKGYKQENEEAAPPITKKGI